MSEAIRKPGNAAPSAPLNFEQLVNEHYDGLYRFGISLARNPDDAADYTQQTFYLLQTKGHQLRDRSRIKSWLYTTLYREFLKRRRHETRFPKIELSEVESELPHISTDQIRKLDASALLEELQKMELRYRAPLVLFYLKDLSYKEIAEILDMPIGTVMSRLSRAKSQLRQQLHRKVYPLAPTITRGTPDTTEQHENDISLQSILNHLLPSAA